MRSLTPTPMPTLRPTVWPVLISTLLLVSGTGCAFEVAAPVESHSTTTAAAPTLGFTTDQTRVQLISAVVGGKNVFLPATVVVTAGAGRVLSFFNTTEKAHGMTIGGLGVSVELPPGEEYLVELPALEGGNVYAILCHLHGAHRGGTLVVLPGQ